MTTHDIIIELADSKVVSSFCFKTFHNYDLLQKRINMDSQLRQVFQLALEKREKYDLPFWDSFNLSLFNSELNNFDFFKEIIFHNKYKEKIRVNNLEISTFLKEIDDNVYLTVNSKIKDREGISLHLILLDFHIPISITNQIICVEIIKFLNLKGYLLDSGKSYHFFGTEPVSKIDKNKILYKALMFSPIIDRAWITHQLIEKSCSLRISKKYERLPVVVQKI